MNPRYPLPSVIIPSAEGGPLATGEDAPTTRWMNPMWDQWMTDATQASGGDMPVFGARGSSLNKLPTDTPASLAALKQLAWGGLDPGWRSLEAPRKKLENY